MPNIFEKLQIITTKICTPLLARKIKYINEQNNKDNILVFVNNQISPDTIFLYYYSSDKNDESYMDLHGYGKNFQIDSNSQNMPEELKNIFDEKYNENDFISYDFYFVISIKTKTIYTRQSKIGYKKGKTYTISETYLDDDIIKILKDLLNNGIITEKYKLVINKDKINVADIISQKEQIVKRSSGGNLILYHGTSMGNWKSIKKHGGLNNKYSQTRNEFGYIEGITDNLIYLTASINVAKSYSTSHKKPFDNENDNNPVVLEVIVPDMSLLFPDDDYMSETIDYHLKNLIESLKSNADSESLVNEVKKLTRFQNRYGDVMYRIKDTITNSAIPLEKFETKYKGYLILAIISNDISVLIKALNLKDSTAIEALKAVYNYFKQSIGNEFHSTKAIRTCLSSTEYSNGVSYFGRIPLSHIIAVYDIKGNKIK